jgi:hypothetical protein
LQAVPPLQNDLPGIIPAFDDYLNVNELRALSLLQPSGKLLFKSCLNVYYNVNIITPASSLVDLHGTVCYCFDLSAQNVFLPVEALPDTNRPDAKAVHIAFNNPDGQGEELVAAELIQPIVHEVVEEGLQIVSGCTHYAIPACVRGYCACVGDVIEHPDDGLLGSLIAQRGKGDVTITHRHKSSKTCAKLSPHEWICTSAVWSKNSNCLRFVSQVYMPRASRESPFTAAESFLRGSHSVAAVEAAAAGNAG